MTMLPPIGKSERAGHGNDVDQGRMPATSERYRLAAEARQNALTKPPGSLGTLEMLAVRLASLQERERPRADAAPILLFAGDHGITAQGVSAYPSAVTVEMLRNFARGGAAISVLARELGVKLQCRRCGDLGGGGRHGVVTDKPRRGTRDFSLEPAMTNKELEFAFEAGEACGAARRGARRRRHHPGRDGDRQHHLGGPPSPRHCSARGLSISSEPARASAPRA